jgi:hypothetical protein
MSTPLVNRADWRHSAACRCADRELFVPVGTPGPPGADRRGQGGVPPLSRRVRPCQMGPRARPEICGVRAGTTEAERRAPLVVPRRAPVER